MLNGKHTLADLDNATRDVAEAQRRAKALQTTIRRRRESGRSTEDAEQLLSSLQDAARQSENRRRLVAHAILRGE